MNLFDPTNYKCINETASFIQNKDFFDEITKVYNIVTSSESGLCDIIVLKYTTPITNHHELKEAIQHQLDIHDNDISQKIIIMNTKRSHDCRSNAVAVLINMRWLNKDKSLVLLGNHINQYLPHINKYAYTCISPKDFYYVPYDSNFEIDGRRFNNKVDWVIESRSNTFFYSDHPQLLNYFDKPRNPSMHAMFNRYFNDNHSLYMQYRKHNLYVIYKFALPLNDYNDIHRFIWDKVKQMVNYKNYVYVINVKQIVPTLNSSDIRSEVVPYLFTFNEDGTAIIELYSPINDKAFYKSIPSKHIEIPKIMEEIMFLYNDVCYDSNLTKEY